MDEEKRIDGVFGMALLATVLACSLDSDRLSAEDQLPPMATPDFLNPDGEPPRWYQSDCIVRFDFEHPDGANEITRLGTQVDWMDHAIAAAFLRHLPI